MQAELDAILNTAVQKGASDIHFLVSQPSCSFVSGLKHTLRQDVDVFPPNQQQQVRTQLAETLRGIVDQILLPKQDLSDRVVATEVLISTHAVGNIIRQGVTEQLHSIIQTGPQFGDAYHGQHVEQAV